MLDSKMMKKKKKSPFIIYSDLESILVPEDNGKQNSEQSYTNTYQKHIAYSHGYKLICDDEKFSKPFKRYSSEDAVKNFINSKIEESKYCSEMMKTYSNKELVMTKDISGIRAGRRGRAPPFSAISFFCNHFEELQTMLTEVKLIINNALLIHKYYQNKFNTQ